MWCTDMASCNYNCINKVYGHEALTKMNGHEFHYNQSVQAIGRTTAKQLSQFWCYLQYAHLFCGMNACIMSKDLKDQIT